MERKHTRRKFLDALNERVLIYDGANGTALQNMNLSPEQFGGEQYNGCMDYLAITYPPAIDAIHRQYFEVGVDVVESNTLGANPIALDEYKLREMSYQINKSAASIARMVADEFSTPDHPRFVAGSMGPSGKLPSSDDPDLSDVDYDELAESFEIQARGLIDGGVDLLLIETSQDILEVKATIKGIQMAFESTGEILPIQCQVTLDTSGRMLFGTDIKSALSILERLPIDVIGLNCSTGPEHMTQPIAYLGENSSLPVSCLPNAGLPMNVDGEAVYPLKPAPFAEALTEFIEKYTISVVGGCCGTTPEHLEKLVASVHGRQTPQRPEKISAHMSSSFSAVNMEQEPRPFLIGERLNATGSRAFKRLVLAEDWDGMIELARKQIESGAHALDVSVAITESPDEKRLMTTLVKKLAMSVPAPLVIDSTEPDIMAAALKVAPGRAMLNSTHLESGRPKLEQVLKIAKEHNSVVMILTIDEEGMAKTAERKLEIAKRIHDIAVNEFGFRPQDLIFDTLTFPLSTGDPEFVNSAVATLDSIKMIKKELPGVFTSLGVSNVSFGLSKAARPVLNSLLLHHAVQNGLDMAIIHASKVRPYAEIPEIEKNLIEDLIFNRRPDALQRVIAHYENIKLEKDSAVDPTEGMSSEELLHYCILHRHKSGIEAAIDELIKRNEKGDTHETAVHVLNHVLLPAMKEVGERFGAGELILPFVLQSAEVMKTSVTHLENYLERVEGVSKGKIVLATVLGDVHDIGKNLVKTILANNGYEVVDLGKQVPAEEIISKAVEENATAIGLSALLVSTSKQMPLIVNEMQKRGLNFPVMIGGAAINDKFGQRIMYTENGELYQPGVFYCKDAFSGLETMENLIDPDRRKKQIEELISKAERDQNKTTKSGSSKKSAGSKVSPAENIPVPSKWGAQVVREIPLEMVFSLLNKKSLYRLSWGAKNKHGEEWERLQTEFDIRLEQMKKEALSTGWLAPQAVYGYFHAQADGDELVIYDPKDNSKVISRFNFPRQTGGENLSLSDYFVSAESDVMDTVAFQVVTVGHKATEKFDALQKTDQYSEGFFVHGLAVQTAEATAEYMHQHIRRELGLGAEQGKRYSWGYTSIPELDDHRKLFDLLPAEQELGMELTSAFQLVPEQSTAAIILHHPKAKYFVVK